MFSVKRRVYLVDETTDGVVTEDHGISKVGREWFDGASRWAWLVARLSKPSVMRQNGSCDRLLLLPGVWAGGKGNQSG